MSPDTPASLLLQLEELRERIAKLEAQDRRQDRISLIVFSGSLDHQLAAFSIATAAAACGMDVMMFFTFWGLSALRDPHKQSQPKTLLRALFGRMLPQGTLSLPLSQWNVAGLGSWLMRRAMSEGKLTSLEEMFKLSEDLEIKLFACDMSMRALGISKEELIEHPQLSLCGAATFVERASAGKITLFI